MVHHFIHLLKGLGLAVGGLGAVIGWFTHMTYRRIRYGRKARA